MISEKSNFYNLTIETIGRVEKISETDKIYIPYIISGDISDIFLFIEELENSDKKISFTDSITQISTLPQGRLTTKISSNVLNITNKDIKEEKFFPISKLNNQKITKIKYLNFNNRIYIIVNYKNNSKNIFYVGEEIVFDNSKYRIILENNYPFLQQIKN